MTTPPFTPRHTTLAPPRTLTVPVAVITAYGSAENAVAALKAGAFDFLGVPDPYLKSSWEHCRNIVLRAEEGTVYPALHRSYFWRIISFFSFMFSSVWTALQVCEVELVLGTTPPMAAIRDIVKDHVVALPSPLSLLLTGFKPTAVADNASVKTEPADYSQWWIVFNDPVLDMIAEILRQDGVDDFERVTLVVA